MKLLLLSPGNCDNPQTWSGTSINLLRGFKQIKDINISHVNMYRFIPKVLKGVIRLYGKFFFIGGNNTRNKLCYPILSNKCARYIAQHNVKGWNLFIADHATTYIGSGIRCAAYIDADYMAWAPNAKGLFKESYLKYYNHKTRESLHKMDYIFTMNEWTRDFTIRHYNISADKVFNVGFGINVTPFFGEKDYSNKRMLIVLRKGREKLKGLYLLLEAFALAKKEIKDLSLDIVGTDFGEGIEGVRCWYNYPRSKTAELFQKSSIYIMPSKGEPNGITYLEALANKSPIIGLRGFAVPEFSGKGKYGFIVDEASPDNVSDTIIEAFRDTNRLKKMGEEGQKYVIERFTWENVTKNMYEIMNKK